MWGATQGATKGNSPAHKFQFTHPVWGATDLFGKAIAPHLSFNSRTPCGVRQVTRIHFHVSTCFNSRTPCGVRPADCITAPPLAYSFNSRTPCGVRLIVIFQGHTQIRRFNSRTPCGVRLSCFLSIQFTHPVWGATKLLLVDRTWTRCFNSRTPCGVRHS